MSVWLLEAPSLRMLAREPGEVAGGVDWGARERALMRAWLEP